MTQTQKLLLSIGILVVVRVAANRFTPAGRSGPADACKRFADEQRRTCYAQVFSEHLKQHGVADAVATLDAVATADPDAAEHAHEFAHGIGIEAYGLSNDIPATFTACGDAFSSGCRHGVIQAYFEARDQVTRPEVESLCQPFKSPGASRWVLFQCVHGMGHGLTMLYAHDLPRALTDCDLLSDGWDRESCYGGAFMESVINATTPHHPATMLAAHSHHHMTSGTTFKALDSADPLYPCSIMADKYLNACYQMQTSVMLNLNHGNIGDAAKSCEKAPSQVRPVCFQSLGRDITSYTAREPGKTSDLCHKAAEPYRPSCYFGAAKALVDWTATTGAAFAFCRIVAHEAGGPTCYHALGEEIATLLAGLPEREAECVKAEEPEGRNACRRGAGVPESR